MNIKIRNKGKLKRAVSMMIMIILILEMVVNPMALGESYAIESSNDDSKLKTVRALSAIIMDEKNDRVLWEKNARQIRAMASLTKIMTAICALENFNLDDEFSVTQKAASMPETKLFFKEGEVYTLESLLYAIMLKSANDAAATIAGGRINYDDFIELMNKKAKEIGCQNTNFVTPNGLDYGKKDHYSTAYDMAKITSYALKNKKFCEIIQTKNKTITSVDNKRSFDLSNSNRFLYMDCDIRGVKTGFTNLAGQCFAGYYSDGKKSFVTVVLASGWGKVGKEAKWTDTKSMIDYARENYEEKEIIKAKEYIISSPIVEDSYNKRIRMYTDKEFKILISKKDDRKIKLDAVMYNNKAPINEGGKVAFAKIKINDAEISEITLITKKEIEKRNFKNTISKIIRNVKRKNIKNDT